MIINGSKLIISSSILNGVNCKEKAHGFSYGLSEVGYDLRIKQRVIYYPPDPVRYYELMKMQMENESAYIWSEFKDELRMAFFGSTCVFDEDDKVTRRLGRTALASSVESFDISNDMWCEFRNKSTWARQFVDAALGTDGEPGWEGHLTIEIIFHDVEQVEIQPGTGILKAVFHEITEPAQYEGKYQNQEDMPIPAILKD
jgi:dCTP deaminase